MSTISKLKKLNNKDLRKIIEVFDSCIECWDNQNPEKCELQPIRKKLGLKECDMIKQKKWIQKREEEKVRKKK